MSTPTALERCLASHREQWGRPDLVVRAPGRVNLIGEHTDYNEGFAMPMALPFDTVIAASSLGDPDIGDVVIASEGFGEVTFDPTTDVAVDLPSGVKWAKHLIGVVQLLRSEGVPAGGWRATVSSDIPAGAGLSSSAGIEVAAITMLLARAGLNWSPIRIAHLGQRVETEVIGLRGGIMDQFISAGAIDGHASLMDCRSFTLAPTPLPESVVVAIMDTGTRRVLAETAYADRHAACERAAAALGVTALRDATIEQLESVADDIDRQRARHVITENQRTLDASEAMKHGDAAELGRLMTASHISLRDDFEVSGPGLDAIVEVALQVPGCVGARMTGGGFAGCAVALVRTDAAERFQQAVLDGYRYGGHTARVWICGPTAGAAVIPLDQLPA